MIDPGVTDPNQYDQATVGCEVDEQNLLSCSVRDQDVLQLFANILSIAAAGTAGGMQSTFRLVQLA
jgi:regulation of enolase protein 1 (concanavalin A-like superfamily)